MSKASDHGRGASRSRNRAGKSASRREFLRASAFGAAALGVPLILSGAGPKPAVPAKVGDTAAPRGGATVANSPANPAAASTEANSKIKLAIVGCGGQGRSDLKNLLANGAACVAMCDVDKTQIAKARADILRVGGEKTKDAKAYEDYRELLARAEDFDAVLIATPDHWHSALAKAFMKAGKHVFCEKPLAHSVSEARELRELARSSKVITQMGNQGSASVSLRRCVEVIKAGALGEIREIYHWGIGVTGNEGSAEGEDPVPETFNWDMWVGPSAMRKFKKDVYHPFKWRGWFDFGNSGLADFCCHAINLPLRALDLNYPEKLVVNVKDGKQLPEKAALEFHFGARGKLPPVVLHWQGSGKPPAKILEPLIAVYKDKNKLPNGLMIIGEKGRIYTSHWNTNGLIQLEGEERLKDVTRHEATKSIAESLPRAKNHYAEWINAIGGQGKAFSDFDFGGKLTEIGLSGVVALRTGRTIEWDGEKMQARNAAEAQKFVRTEVRGKWVG